MTQEQIAQQEELMEEVFIPCRECGEESVGVTGLCEKHLEEVGDFVCDWCGKRGSLQNVVAEQTEFGTIFKYHEECVRQQESEDIFACEVESAMADLRNIQLHYGPIKEKNSDIKSVFFDRVMEFIQKTIEGAENLNIRCTGEYVDRKTTSKGETDGGR